MTSETIQSNTPTNSKPQGLERYLRLKQLAETLGVSHSTIYRWVRTEGLPEPIKLAANTVAWRESEIKAWLDSRGRGLTTMEVG